MICFAFFGPLYLSLLFFFLKTLERILPSFTNIKRPFDMDSDRTYVAPVFQAGDVWRQGLLLS